MTHLRRLPMMTMTVIPNETAMDMSKDTDSMGITCLAIIDGWRTLLMLGGSGKMRGRDASRTSRTRGGGTRKRGDRIGIVCTSCVFVKRLQFSYKLHFGIFGYLLCTIA